jgi:hypothetical protein
MSDFTAKLRSIAEDIEFCSVADLREYADVIRRAADEIDRLHSEEKDNA